jgi:hypothetical protein
VRITGLIALLMLGAAVAEARPGGGESYSGGGGHGGGGGGDGAELELLIHLIRLCIYYPQIGVPLTALVIGYFLWQALQKQKTKDWDSGPPVRLQRTVSLDAVRRHDPDFSPVLFEDFCFRLYATCHQARHRDDRLAALAPYVDEDARRALAARQPREPVTGVVIGAMRPTLVRRRGDRVIVGLELEANYTVEAQGTRTFYVVERWRLIRAADARTRPRAPGASFPCPNCGAPWEASRTHEVQQCAYCDQIVDNGRFDWQVCAVDLVHAVDKPPTLTRAVPERGTDLPTYRAPRVDARWNQLLGEDPALTEPGLLARLHVIYQELYDAWAAGDLAPARPYLSDGLFDYLTYWLEAYARQGLANRLEGMRVTHVVLAKVSRDRWYDAVTVRLWGTGKDYVVRASTGKHVRGSRHRDRPYSEYWTLIRSAERRGPARADRACGHCGAPAQVGMGGACLHCGAHVTAGEFDWVLSKIEQDDSYRG